MKLKCWALFSSADAVTYVLPELSQKKILLSIQNTVDAIYIYIHEAVEDIKELTLVGIVKMLCQNCCVKMQF